MLTSLINHQSHGKKKNIDIGNKSASCQWWNVNLVKIWGMGNWIQEQGDEMGTVENGINGKKGKELGSKLWHNWTVGSLDGLLGLRMK